MKLDEIYLLVFYCTFLSYIFYGEKFLKMYSPIHFTIGIDIEATFAHIKSIPTRVDVTSKVVVFTEST